MTICHVRRDNYLKPKTKTNKKTKTQNQPNQNLLPLLFFVSTNYRFLLLNTTMEASLPSAWWDKWVEEALTSLDSLKVLRSLRPICLRNQKLSSFHLQLRVDDDAFEVFDEMHQWDRSSVQVEIGETTFRKWMHDTPSSGKNYPFATLLHVKIMLAVLTLFKLFFFLSMLVILHVYLLKSYELKMYLVPIILNFVFNPIQFSGYKQSM
jgi:hypothetical protein